MIPNTWKSCLSTLIGQRAWKRLALGASLSILIIYVLVPPLAPLDKARLIGYSICHQIPERSFHIHEHQLPLCARCTGTYLGIAIGFLTLALRRRWRAGHMLSAGMLVIMVIMIGIMGIDGVNSYIALLRGQPLFYEPQNWLRAITGSLNGLALSMIVWPVFNMTLWKTPQPVRPLETAWELVLMLAVNGLVVAITLTGADWLLYPLSLISVGGVLWMLTLVNTMILLILFQQDSRAETRRQAVLPLLGGLVISLLELTAMGVFRYALTGTLSWPI